MQRGFRVVVAVALVAAASLVIRADATPSSQASEIQLQLGDLLSAEGRFLEALDAYRSALKSAPPDEVRRPRIGVIMAAHAVFETHMLRNAVTTMKPPMMAPGRAPTSRSVKKAMRRSRPQRSMARPMMKPPMNRKITSEA